MTMDIILNQYHSKQYINSAEFAITVKPNQGIAILPKNSEVDLENQHDSEQISASKEDQKITKSVNKNNTMDQIRYIKCR